MQPLTSTQMPRAARWADSTSAGRPPPAPTAAEAIGLARHRRCRQLARRDEVHHRPAHPGVHEVAEGGQDHEATGDEFRLAVAQAPRDLARRSWPRARARAERYRQYAISVTA